ncbi:alpha/beta hydrolase [Polymorphospora sp. NPDC051019]|uniref:alpha/beta hydrolase n=1 Tax=Polymorphospora sp. NPDC051019 TaxID=3155725 RepID=UPI00341A0AA1
MTLHPQVVAALAVRPRPTSEVVDADPLAALAAGRAAMLAAVPAECGPPVPVASVSDVDADGVPCRLYAPAPGVPVLVYVHGGGWAMGNVEIVDAFCRRVADRSGCAVLSVDYRLAPEHPYPAGVDDVETALTWLRREGLGLDVSRVAIGGDSAGGHLATVVARRQRDAGRPLAHQVLIYPVIDPAMASDSYRDLGGAGLDRATMARFWDLFVPDPADRAAPDVAPLAAPLAGMPPTLLITAEYDVLRDEGERYGVELLAAGVPVVTVRYQGVNHGFVRKLAIFDAAAVATDQIAAALRAALV